MELDNIREQARTDECRARVVRRIVESQEFEDAFKLAGRPPNVADPDKLRKWIRQTLYSELEDMTYSELRSLAQAKFIPYYSRMNKLELLGAIYAAGVVPTRKPVK